MSFTKKFSAFALALFLCFTTAFATSYTNRTVYLFQQVNTFGGATKTTGTGYVSMNNLILHDCSAVTFVPIYSSGNNAGSPVTVYNGFSGTISHYIGKGNKVDLKFYNAYYSPTNGSLSCSVNWY